MNFGVLFSQLLLLRSFLLFLFLRLRIGTLVLASSKRGSATSSVELGLESRVVPASTIPIEIRIKVNGLVKVLLLNIAVHRGVQQRFVRT